MVWGLKILFDLLLWGMLCAAAFQSLLLFLLQSQIRPSAHLTGFYESDSNSLKTGMERGDVVNLGVRGY